MKKLFNRLLKQWEKTLCWIFLLALGATVLLWVAGFAERESDLVTTPSVPTRKAILGDNAFAFREPPPDVQSENAGNPFGFFRRLREKTSDRPWKGDPDKPVKKPREQPPQKPPQTQTQEPKNETKEPPKPPEKKEPEKPKRFIALLYRGMYEGPSRKPLAFIRATDSETKKKTSRPVPKGTEIEGIVVSDFSESNLTVVQPDGKELTIPIGAQKKIFLE
jgi:hypothetical protein